MIYKQKDITANVNNKSVDIGNIGVNFYSEDESTASIRITLKSNEIPIDLKITEMRPRLDLFCADGSIFVDEELEYILPNKGIVQYKIPTKVIKHIGEVNAKIFLVSVNAKVHVANFKFNIIDSGIDGVIEKEVSINLVYNTVKDIIKNDTDALLNEEFKSKVSSEVVNYVNQNTEKFKGPAGADGSDSKLKGLTGVFVGDSITETNFRTTTNYHGFIAKRTGLNVVNMGISGTGYQDRKNVALDVKEQPDFISVFMGTNDWGLVGNKINPLGDAKSLEYNTVAGSIYYTLLQLTQHFPTTPIVVLTPLPRIECNPFNEVKNKAGYSLGELVEVIKQLANKFGLPVLDLYHECNLKVWINNVNKVYFAYAEGKEDGLHPNAKGHEFISHMIQSFYENYAIATPKVPFKEKIKPDENLGNGIVSKYVYPSAIFWKQDQSMIINFKQTDIDLTNKKVLKLESGTGSIINSMGLSSNSPYWYTLPNYADGSNYSRVSEVKSFTDSLTKIGYTSGRGFEYLPELLKVTYVDSTSNAKGSYTTSDGIAPSETKPTVDVDSPVYVTPQSNKPDENLGNGLTATYIYPKRMFWIKNQSFSVGIDPFDFNIEEKSVKRIEYNGKILENPNAISVNTASWYQLNNYADGNTYNRLTEISRFVDGIPTISDTPSRVDYKQVELKLVYGEKTYTPSGGTTTPTTTVTPVTPTKNSDGSFTATVKPFGMYWKQDQSFMVNIDKGLLDLTGKTVTKIEYSDKSLVNANAITSNSPYWFTVPTNADGTTNNRTTDVTNFVSGLELESTDAAGRKKYKNIDIKITYK